MIAGKRGFTLIELLIVLIIIGVLATLAIPQYTSYVEKARAAEALAMISALKTGEATYKLDTGSYTTNIGSLNISNATSDEAASSNAGQLWFYQGTNAGTQGYSIEAKRTSRAGGTNTQYIRFTWSDTAGASWSGNHPGAPKQ